MALMSYRKLLAMGKEAIQQAKAIPRAAEMKMKAMHEMSKIDVEIADQDAKISDASAEYPIDFLKIIRAIDDKAILERRKKLYGQIVEEMFPDEDRPAKKGRGSGGGDGSGD